MRAVADLSGSRRQYRRSRRRREGDTAATAEFHSASVHVDLFSDRSQTIRASVSDVEHTLILTIVLVVLIIFAFLREPWATAIPSITVPLSIVATFPVMYLLGYSIDNLSLMGLTIAVGFVVDDAIVMIENIVRYHRSRRFAIRGRHRRSPGKSALPLSRSRFH